MRVAVRRKQSLTYAHIEQYKGSCALVIFAAIGMVVCAGAFWSVIAWGVSSCTLNTHPIGHRIDPGTTIVGSKPAPPYVAGAQGNGDE